MVDDTDPDDRVFREFTAFGLELARFADDWDAFFPGLSPTGEPLRTAAELLDVDALYERTRPRTTKPEPARRAAPPPTSPVASPRLPDARSVGQWIEQGNDLKAAVVLARAGDPSAGAAHSRSPGRPPGRRPGFR